MSDNVPRRTVIQDHAAFLAREHDFQTDIEMLAGSDLVGTILETVMLATNMRFAAVARVTADRWVACRTADEVSFGLLAGDEIEIDSTFCKSVRETSEKVLFNDVATDDVYRNHPIAARFGIVSYASIPVRRSDGSFFGTLCAIATEPRDVKHPRVVAMLEMFADIIGRSLEAEERLEAQEQLVAHERDLARVQEEFVAVLGHDLRNPVAALDAGLRQLAREPLSDKARTMLPLMRSSVHRMNDLLDNILLHAKARLGGGIRVSATPDAPLVPAITQVVDEIRAATPEREILVDLEFDRPVSCDAARVAQAVSNLISNAIRHGTPGTPVEVSGSVGEGGDRDFRGQPGRIRSGKPAPTPVRALPEGRPAERRGAGPWPVHRVLDRRCAWRSHRRRVRRGDHDLHLHAAMPSGGCLTGLPRRVTRGECAVRACGPKDGQRRPVPRQADRRAVDWTRAGVFRRKPVAAALPHRRRGAAPYACCRKKRTISAVASGPVGSA